MVVAAVFSDPQRFTLHHTVVQVTTGTAQDASLQVFYRAGIGPSSVVLFETPSDVEQFVSFGSGALSRTRVIKNGELDFHVFPNISKSSNLHRHSSDIVFDNVTSTNALSNGDHEPSHNASVTLHGHLTHPNKRKVCKN